MKHVLLSIIVLICLPVMLVAQEQQCRYGFSYEVSNSPNWGKGKPVITGVYAFSPAALAGIKPYDIIEAVDGKPVTDDVLDEIHLFLNPENKETVEFTIRNFGNEARKVKIKKDCKSVQSLSEEMLASAFAMYAVEYTHERLFTCPFTTTQTKDSLDFSMFKSFAFAGETDSQPKPAEKIQSLIKKEFTAKGLLYDADAPDVLVHVRYSLNKNALYTPPKQTPTEQNKTEQYTYRYNIANDKMEKLPCLPVDTKESDAEYVLILGFRIEDSQTRRTVWECESHEWMHKRYPIENFASIHIPLMCMQFPYLKYGRNVQYRLSRKKYFYTGINYGIDNLSEVVSVDPQSPAAKAGIRPADRIDAIADKRFDRTATQFTSAYHKFITKTRHLRNESARFVDARGFGCTYWDEWKYPLIVNEFNKKKYLTAFAYLYGYAPFIDPSGGNAYSFKLRRGAEKLSLVVCPEIRSEILLTIE